MAESSQVYQTFAVVAAGTVIQVKKKVRTFPGALVAALGLLQIQFASKSPVLVAAELREAQGATVTGPASKTFSAGIVRSHDCESTARNLPKLNVSRNKSGANMLDLMLLTRGGLSVILILKRAATLTPKDQSKEAK